MKRMNIIRRIQGSFEDISKGLLRRVLEPLGICAFSKVARHGMDDALAQYLPERGVFIEAGATDGVTESNTYYLEKCKGWSGILIEPIPSLYSACAALRKRSQVFNCALVADDYSGTTVTMKEGHLMSTVKGALGKGEKEHLEKAAYFHGTGAGEVTVPARTLTSILDEAGVGQIDFLSLDVEGYEREALLGLDLARHRPAYLLIELLDVEKRKRVEELITPYYAYVEQISKRDHLYKAK